MKRTFSVILGIFILILSGAFAHAVVPEGADLEVSLISQEPDPAEPGEVIDLRFKIENKGSAATENIMFEFVEEFPFTVYTGSAKKEIGSLQGLQKDEEGIIVLYKIKVDEEALEKTNYIDVRYKTEDHDVWITEKDFPVRTRTRDLILTVESISSEPKLVSPGEEFRLSMTLRNNADSLIKDAKVKLDLSGDDIPFAPSGSTAEKQIPQISSKTGKKMDFSLVAMPDSEGGIYKIPITLSYTEESGDTASKEDVISLKITSEPDLLLTIDDSEITADKRSGNVVIKIANRGLTNIKLLTAKLAGSEGFKVSSEKEIYVGNVDSDDYETVEFGIQLTGYDDRITLPVELEYRDSTNKVHVQKEEMELKTMSKSLSMRIFSGIFNTLIVIAIIAAVLIAVRWVYKKRKAKRRG